MGASKHQVTALPAVQSMGGSSRIFQNMVMLSTRTIEATRTDAATSTSSYSMTPTYLHMVSHGVAQHLAALQVPRIALQQFKGRKATYEERAVILAVGLTHDRWRSIWQLTMPREPIKSRQNQSSRGNSMLHRLAGW